MTAKNSASEKTGITGTRLNYALGPLAAGIILDAVDLITFGPVGLVLGIPVGALAGYWLARSLRLPQNTSLFCAALAAVYCTIPGTEILPLGTLVGALVRFEEAAPSVEDQNSARPDLDASSSLANGEHHVDDQVHQSDTDRHCPDGDVPGREKHRFENGQQKSAGPSSFPAVTNKAPVQL